MPFDFSPNRFDGHEAGQWDPKDSAQYHATNALSQQADVITEIAEELHGEAQKLHDTLARFLPRFRALLEEEDS